MKVNLLGLNKQGLIDFLNSLGEKPFRATQILKWLHQRRISDFSSMTDLSLSLREKLQQVAEVKPLEVKKIIYSEDKTQKWLLALPGGSIIETVYIPEPERHTLCVSSQAGCVLNCTFCATARQGFNRNLTTAEIISQLWLVLQKVPKITNIVFMGMGEPLLNLDNVLPALDIMRDDFAYGLSRRRITVSTSGVVPGIERLGKYTDVALALSLHAPTNALRDTLIPLNKKYPLEMVLEACKNYLGEAHRDRLSVEYTMIKGINDSSIQAKQLCKVLEGIRCKVNLIPFNPFTGVDYERPSLETILAFKRILSLSGLTATVRKTRGDDVGAACGQLEGAIIDKTKRSQRFLVNLEEKGVQIHAS